MGLKHSTEEINRYANEEFQSASLSSASDVARAFFPQEKNIAYVQDYSLTSDPTAILGSVYYQVEGSDEFLEFHTGVETSLIPSTGPKTQYKLSELLIDTKVAAEMGYLPLVSGTVGADQLFEISVILNDGGLIDNKKKAWRDAFADWSALESTQELLSNEEVTSVSIARGVAQFYVTSKAYTKFEAGVKGGYLGLNLGGTVYTSSSQSTLRIIHGLSLVSLTPGKAKPKSAAADGGVGILSAAGKDAAGIAEETWLDVQATERLEWKVAGTSRQRKIASQLTRQMQSPSPNRAGK